MKPMNTQTAALAKVLAPVLLAYHTAEMKLESGFKTFLHDEFHKYWDKLPDSKKATNELAVQWKNDAKDAADSLGYQGQWVGKCLMAIEPDLFRQRARRSNAGKKAGANKRTAEKPVKPLTDAQVRFEVEVIRRVARKLHLDSVAIEKLIVAIGQANSELAAARAA